MKLAEALQERADLNRTIQQLKERLDNNVLVQEGEQPAEQPERLKQELDAAIQRLEYLMARINHTNCQTCVEGKSLTELIARKDALSLKLRVYKELVYSASQTAYRARNTEIKIKSAISVSDWQAQVDRMAKELRLLDNRLQESNWTTDLIEYISAGSTQRGEGQKNYHGTPKGRWRFDPSSIVMPGLRTGVSQPRIVRTGP